MLEGIIQPRIEQLEKFIKMCCTDEWQEKERDGDHDTNGYFWNYGGEAVYFSGKLAALKELLELDIDGLEEYD